MQVDTAVAPASLPAVRSSGVLAKLAVLFKLRVVSLLLVAAGGGAVLAAGGWPGAGPLLLVAATGGLAAAGSGALNQVLERKRDALMQRTARRPLVIGGFLSAGRVTVLALLLIFVPALLVLPSNRALSLFVWLGAAIYVGVYTLWLKPRTLLNIVIGGAAGSAAVLSGSAAVGNWGDPGAVTLALLVFLWTPTHFWSLALVYRDDYAAGGIPMLPTRVSGRSAVLWMMVHTVPTALAGIVLAAHPALGYVYLLPITAASIYLIVRNLQLLQNHSREAALSFFKYSNIYLALIVLMIFIDAAQPFAKV